MKLFNYNSSTYVAPNPAKISYVTQASNSEWDQIVDNCAYSTYFHTREWMEIWSAYFGNRTAKALIFHFEDGTKALLPFSEELIYKGFIASRKSSAESTFGGWISDTTLDVRQHEAIWEYLTHLNLTNLSKIYITQNPYDPSLAEADIPWEANTFTQTLNLRKGFDAVYANMNRGHKSSINKAIREGITVELAFDFSEWEEYYAAYKDSLERWDSKQLFSWEYDHRLFEILYKLHSPKIKLWVAKLNGKVISGAICFYHANHVVYWHGSALKEYFELRPNNLLHMTIIKQACEGNYNWYDFNPSGGFEGVIRFKEGFGCEKKPYGSISSIYKIKNQYRSLKNHSRSVLEPVVTRFRGSEN